MYPVNFSPEKSLGIANSVGELARSSLVINLVCCARQSSEISQQVSYNLPQAPAKQHSSLNFGKWGTVNRTRSVICDYGSLIFLSNIIF